jgi:hypothetical protein
LLTIGQPVDPGQKYQQPGVPFRDAAAIETDGADVAVRRQLLFDVAGPGRVVCEQPVACQYQSQAVRGGNLDTQVTGHG